MKRIFAVRGVGGSGKSGTVKLVYKNLFDKFPDGKEILRHRPSDRRNICAVLNIMGTMIGIESHNHNGRTKRSLKLFLSHRCDVIVCATLTRGKTVKAVTKRFAKREITWLDLQKPKSKSAKEEVANEIFRAVCAILK